MKEHFPELSFEIKESGLIEIQQYQNMESVSIDIHHEQLRHIGRVVFNGKSSADTRIKDLERRLGVLTDRIVDLINDQYIRAEIIERCANSVEILLRWDNIHDLAYEFDCGLPTKAQLDADEAAAGKGGASVALLSVPKG